MFEKFLFDDQYTTEGYNSDNKTIPSDTAFYYFTLIFSFSRIVIAFVIYILIHLKVKQIYREKKF